ncbi:MAG: leucine-rich repeat domain-containing protein [Oligoflexales bacterium]
MLNFTPNFLIVHLLLSLVVSCTHKEFYQASKKGPVTVISKGEKSCLSKGFRWYWSKSSGCSLKKFKQYCIEEKKLPKSTKLTITVIKNETGKQNCSEAEAELKAQTGLHLDGLGIVDIYPLMGLTHLTILRLDGNKIYDLYPLSKLVKLRVLRLDQNNITKIQHLSKLRELVVLRLDKNNISDLSPLANLVNIAQINLSTNKIISIEPLEKLSRLMKVGLKGNKVKTLLPLSNLEFLEFINLEDNPISRKNFPLNDLNCPITFGVNSVVKNFCESRRKQKT